MKVTVENTEAALAATIDEITNAKAIISLDGHDFADILQNEGELSIIKVEETVGVSNHLTTICDAVSGKFNEIVGNGKVQSLMLFISRSKDYSLMPVDMNSVVNTFQGIELDEVSVKWGVGENEYNTVRLTIVMKIYRTA